LKDSKKIILLSKDVKTIDMSMYLQIVLDILLGLSDPEMQLYISPIVDNIAMYSHSTICKNVQIHCCMYLEIDGKKQRLYI
jgi:hypothetical protein